MPRRHHLREINHDRLSVFPLDEDVELIKVAVDEPGVCELENEGHEFGVEVGWVGDFVYLAAGMSALLCRIHSR